MTPNPPGHHPPACLAPWPPAVPRGSRRHPAPVRWLFWMGIVAGLWSARADQDLERDFATPPERTQPRCYWYWMDGRISPEGLTRDLEAMKRVGIGEAYIGVISGESGLPPGTGPQALTDPWWSHLEHAIREATRIGVDIGLFNSPGWSQSGGPWVRPEQAMRYVVQRELRVRGPRHIELPLPRPEGAIQDLAVQAFPVPPDDAAEATVTERSPTVVNFAMLEPFLARSLTVRPSGAVAVDAELRVSEDGREFVPLKRFRVDRHNLALHVGPVPLAPVVVSFTATPARFFRLTFSAPCELAEVRLSTAPRVASYAEKSLLKMFQDPVPPFDFYRWPSPKDDGTNVPGVPPDRIRDLASALAPDGILRWDVPEGDWVIVRSGLAPTGTRNAPAPPEATGLEVDKMNRPALKTHFDAFVGRLLARLTPAERRSWKHVVADSYEMGPQNWTDGFEADFRERYGYDPMPYLPVLGGRVVGNADRSDRFLWDLRRLVADRVARDYVGGLRDLCREHGLRMWLENYGHWGFPSEFLLYGGQCDEIGGEFWESGDLGRVELRAAASAAHIYGLPVVWAEAFTGGPAFVNTPRDLKARGDWALCEGANQFVLHVYIHQPWEDRRPGVNAWFGTEFNRHNTWFEASRSWIDYLRRCSVLLQAGQPVADVAYFIGEDAPKMAGTRRPPLPAGYDCDDLNADVLLNRLRVRDGRFVLPDGTEYHLLVLPRSTTLRPAVLRRLQELVSEDGHLLGSPPERSPSLQNFPACDEEVRTLAREIWTRPTVLDTSDLRAALRRLDLAPDVQAPADILWKHRRAAAKDADTDIYFLSNQAATGRTETVSFRVSGRAPEFWWPDTGEIEPDVPFEITGGRSTVTVPFEPRGSVFVVFRRKADGPRPGTYAGSRRSDLPAGTVLEAAWELSLAGRRLPFERLVSWTEHADEDVRHFSGEGRYRTTFDNPTPSTAGRTWLDLGQVEEMATVTLNGRTYPTLWKPPYRLDISDAVRPGRNDLVVAVVNPWHNRLAGDAARPAAQRVSWTSREVVPKGAPLQPAGLLGPVRILHPPGP